MLSQTEPQESSSDQSSVYSSDALPPSPSSRPRRRPEPLRMDSMGVDPSDIVGRVLTRVCRSSKHPTLTLDFADGSTFQILVDGYDPVHRGVPKALETAMTDPIFDPPNGKQCLEMTVRACTLITLTDKAFARVTATGRWDRGAKVEEWDQNHVGLAFKFDGPDTAWHCVWATLVDYDTSSSLPEQRQCIFRSYDDVYLERLHRSPRKRRYAEPKPY